MRIPFSGRDWIRGGELLVRHLRRIGVRHVFSVPGAQTLSIYDAIRRTDDIELVVPHSEWNAAFMAEGYGAASGRPAVVLSTLGPGVANEVIGMTSALVSGTPVLFVSPCQPKKKRERLGAVFQGLDQETFFAPYPGRFTRLVDEPRELGPALESAMSACLGEDGGEPGVARVDVSFPMLFRMHVVRREKSVAAPAPRADAQPILVTEDHGGVAYAQLRARRSLDGTVVLAPGIDEVGHAVPFALGARLAQEGAPVAVVTDESELIDNLESVELANAHDVPVRVVHRGREGADISGANRKADVTTFQNTEEVDLRVAVAEDPSALSIISS